MIRLFDTIIFDPEKKQTTGDEADVPSSFFFLSYFTFI
jgi:hypothetical protein